METRHARAVIGLLLLSVVATPVAAHPGGSQSRALLDGLNEQLLYVALPLTLFVLAILVYVVVRFRGNDDPEPTADDPTLEITWTVATAIILIFVGVSSYSILASAYLSPGFHPGTQETEKLVDDPDTVVVEVVAVQFEWRFSYPDEEVPTQQELVVPADENVVLVMTSRDVIHSLSIQSLGVKQDIFPDRETYVHINADGPGEYEAVCIEFCGAGHARMQTSVTVLEPDDYDDWIKDQTAETSDTSSLTDPARTPAR